MKMILIAASAALILAVLAVFGGEPFDTTRDQVLENTMMLSGVPDSVITEMMELRRKPLIVNGRAVDGKYFYVSPDRRRGWAVTVAGGCIDTVQEIFDLDARSKTKR